MPSAQSVMLAIHCKRAEQLDLKQPILSYIRETYTDRDAEEAIDDLQTIQALRNDIVQAQTGSQLALKDGLTKYLRCLKAIETRFPISSEKGHIKVSFVWYDAFRPAKRTSQVNVHLEKAGVLFNLAACMSQQGLTSDRTTPEGITAACKLFQEAAGTYQLLKDTEAIKVDNPKPVDLSPECCSMLEKLMLSQAQECVFHKASMDKKSPGTLAKLAKQTSLMYAEVSAIFGAPLLTAHFERSWVSHTAMKSSLYDVEALVQSGKQLHADDKVAAEIATLQEAFKRIQTTKKLAKAISQEMADSVNGVQDTIQTLLTRAEKDNASIYLERVPDFASLPPVAPVLLVKAQTGAGLQDGAGGEQLFASLIPEASAKALSKYTDMVDSLVRAQLDKLAEATDRARLKLREQELPELLDALDASTHAALPESLLRELEDVQSIGGTQHLKEILGEIAAIRGAVQSDLDQCQRTLDEEATRDAECRSKYGDKWKVPQSSTLAKPFWERTSTYRSNFQQAQDSDAKVIQRLSDQEAAFSGLDPAAAARLMPRLQAPLVNVGSEDPAVVVANLRRQMDALSSLANERAGLEEALKDAKNKDNILPRLMMCSANFDALFAAELKKYDTLVARVDDNVAKNDALLTAVTKDAQAFRAIFEVPAWRQSCESAATATRGTVKTYREVLDHLSEGLRFYMSLQEAIKQQLQTVTDYAYTRQLQRDDLKQDLDRRAREDADAKTARYMAGLNVGQQSQQPTTPAYPTPPSGGPAYQQGQHPPTQSSGGFPTPPQPQMQPTYQQAVQQGPPAYPPAAPYSHPPPAPPPFYQQHHTPPQQPAAQYQAPYSGYNSYGAPPPAQQYGYSQPPQQPQQHQQTAYNYAQQTNTPPPQHPGYNPYQQQPGYPPYHQHQ